jgi:hypothetical protein
MAKNKMESEIKKNDSEPLWRVTDVSKYLSVSSGTIYY